MESIGSDTIPPVIVQHASDETISCQDDQYASALLSWYNLAGGAVAEDNQSSPIRWESTLSYEQVLQLFEDSRANGCSNTGQVEVGYIALDSCDNKSVDTTFANFISRDVEDPFLVVEGHDVSIHCTPDAQDSLYRWIDRYAGAVAADACSDNLNWHSFFWTDNQGRSDFEVPGQRPYIIDIGRESCDWSANFTFLVRDECDNSKAVNVRFSVIDTVAPVLLEMPIDATVTCDDYMPSPTLVGMDNCDRTIMPEFDEQSNRSDDPTECTYYNFEVTRTWRLSDVCGNTSSHVQHISVIDTIVPRFTVPPDVSLSCGMSTDTSETGVPFNIFDNCDPEIFIEYQDEESLVDCKKTITRFWKISDGCGSSNEVPQVITVIDSIAPVLTQVAQNRISACETDEDLDAAFNQWLMDHGGLSFTDDCEGTMVFAALPGSYDIDDPSTFPGTAPPSGYEAMDCSSEEFQIVSQQVVDFVVHDACMNAVVSTAAFQVVDMTAPVFEEVPMSPQVLSEAENCGFHVRLSFPSFHDNCSGENTLFPFLKINEGSENTVANPTQIDTFLSVGQNIIQYIVYDCADNRSVVRDTFHIDDEVPPQINCPEDLTVYLDSTGCEISVMFPTNFVINDNCAFGRNISRNSTDKFVIFDTNVESSIALPQDFQIDFEDVGANIVGDSAVIEIEYSGDFDHDEEYWIIVDENGKPLFTTEGNNQSQSCEGTLAVEHTVDVDYLNSLATNGTISFVISANSESLNEDNGINPCSTLDSLGRDESTFVSMNIRYQSNTAKYFVEGATGIEEKPFPFPDYTPIEDLNQGTNLVSYIAEDLAGNKDTCSFKIIVLDTIAPEISCVDTVIRVHPSGLINFQLTRDEVMQIDEDNCAIDSIHISKTSYNCSEIGQSFEVNVTATDRSNNSSTCQVTVRVESTELLPSFSTSACNSDTLFLFSNLIDTLSNASYSYMWSGPQDYSSTDPNPILINPTESQQGIYTLTATSENGCVSTGEVEVSITEVRMPIITTTRDSICVGDSITLTTNAYVGELSYHWFFQNENEDPTILDTTDMAQITIIPELGEHRYTVVAVDDQCSSLESDPLSIRVLPAPNITLGQEYFGLCEGDNLIFQIIEIDTNLIYTWQGPNEFQSSEAIPDTLFDVNTDMNGIYQLIVSNGICEQDTLSAVLEVFDRPDRPEINADNNFCHGDNILLVSNITRDSLSYIWYRNGELYSETDHDSLLISQADTSHSAVWTLELYDEQCSSLPSPGFQIQVEDIFDLQVSSNSPLCDMDSLRLNSQLFDGASYQWTGPSNFMAEIPNPIIEAQEGNYVLTVISELGCHNTDSVQVQVGTRPLLTSITSNAPTCGTGNDTIRLVPNITSPGSYSYQWMGPNGFSSSDSILILENHSLDHNGTYSLIVSNGACDSEMRSVEIDVSYVPDPPTISSVSSVCEGDSLILTAIDFDANTDQFIWSTPTGQLTTQDSFLILQNADNSIEGNYVLQLMAGDCISDPSEAITIQLSSPPSVPTAMYDSPVCQGENLQLRATTISGASYEWRGPNGFLTTGRAPLVFSAELTDAGEYQVRVTIDGCTSDWSAPIDVEIEENPPAPVAIQPTIGVCLDDVNASIQLCLQENSTIAGTRYRWVIGDDAQVIGETTANCLRITDFTHFENGQNNISVRALRGNCQSSLSEFITVEIIEEGSVLQVDAGEDQRICDDELVFLDAQIMSNALGRWTSLDGANVVDVNDADSEVTNLSPGANTFVWSVESIACNTSGVDTVTIFKDSEITLMNENFVIDYNQELLVNPLANDALPSTFDFSILTMPTHVDLVPQENNWFLFVPGSDYIGTAAIVYQVCSTVCPQNCQTATMTIEVGDAGECFFPNLLTPNNDGINDRFVVPCLESGLYPENSLIIFNEWGDQIFHEAPYGNNWNGEYGGRSLPVGTYYYILDFGDGTIPRNGFLVIEQ